MGVEIGLYGLAALLVLVMLRVPIGISLISVSFVGVMILLGPRTAWGILTAVPYDFATKWSLASVPMFLLMGFICYYADLTVGLFDAARKWLSALPGGMAIASVFGAAGFAAVTGSSVACAAAMGRISIPEMLKAGYDQRLATGTVAAAGTIGALIPPSIVMIIYGIFAQVSITKLFIGGLVAGLLTVVSYVIVIVIVVTLKPESAPRITEKVSTAERVDALRQTWPIFLLMAGVIGGLLSGLFTATEAGAMGAFLSILIALFKGTFTTAALKRSLLETARTTSAIFVIAIGATLLTKFLTLSGSTRFLSDFIISVGHDKLTLMIGIVVMYLILGMFLEPMGSMLLTLPILLPVIESSDMSLIWFGVVLTKLLEIGMITPPVGLNVFVIKGVVGNEISTAKIFSGVLWFLVADLVVVLLMMTFPDLIMYLPNMLG